ncbi:unnamed protein product, partial [Strongylus vulgaris]
GLLVDTEPCYTIANEAILSKYGRKFTVQLKGGKLHNISPNCFLIKANIIIQISSMARSIRFTLLIITVGLTDQIAPEEYALHYDIMLAEMFKKCPSLPGAERLVRHLANKGIPMAICSGSCSRSFEWKAENHRDWVDLIPIHDAPNGVKAALAAGMHCVMVPDKMFREEAKTLK